MRYVLFYRVLFHSKYRLFYRKNHCHYVALFFRRRRRFFGAAAAVVLGAVSAFTAAAGWLGALLPRICKITSPLFVVVCGVAGWVLAAELVF